MSQRMNAATYEVGYCKPPAHTRFQPGQSGNPSGRPKGTQNFKTLFDKIMKEQISLREGNVTKKISKAEAIMRGLIISAMKGEARNILTLFKLAEQIGEFDEARGGDNSVQVVVRKFTAANSQDEDDGYREAVPAISQINRE